MYMGLDAGQLAPAFAASALLWLVLSLATIVGRAGYDRRRRSRTSAPPRRGSRKERRLLRQATREGLGEAGRWRRIRALRALARSNHPACRTLLPQALACADVEVAGAAVRSLGDVGSAWAVDELVSALQRGVYQRSRVAAQLERLAPMPGPLLAALLDDRDPAVRFWAATLLAPYPGLATPALVARTQDDDANVRAAAVETLAGRRGQPPRGSARRQVEGPEWFVRVHAARAVGRLGAPADVACVVPLLGDERWWVRSAAKDALRTLGLGAVDVLRQTLQDGDAFARNGAAEVLQDVGYVDLLVATGRDSTLLEQIFAAGGERMRRLAITRAEAAPALPAREVA
jgi:HEAT repeat protein